MFWLLRYLVYNLIHNDSESSKLLKINPLLSDKRPVETWTEGLETTIRSLGSEQIEMILCNIRLNQKMEVRHVLVDPDYFLLVEILPQKKRQEDENKIIQTVDMRVVNIKIHKKVYLRNVESLVDRSEPRNLIIGFA